MPTFVYFQEASANQPWDLITFESCSTSDSFYTKQRKPQNVHKLLKDTEKS
jgi:hypothetical protein